MGIIKDKGIEFYNQKFDGTIYKISKSNLNDPNISFIARFKDSDTIDKFINNVNLAIEGHFDLIADPDVSNGLEIGFITPTGVDFYDQDGQNVIDTLPLEDFKEILIAWRDFLLTPPFDGTKV